jgi:hypothetical protein
LGALLSCGGGGGGGGGGPVTPNALDGPTVLEGAYQANAGENDFVSFVTPNKKLYALYFLVTDPNVVVLPAIFTGPITLGQNGAAEIPTPQLKLFTNSMPKLSSSSGTFSAASSLSYQFAGPSTVSGQTLSPFVASALTTSADLSGTWRGTWADSANNFTNVDSAITFDTQGQLTAWNFSSYCQSGSTLALTPTSFTQRGGTGTFFQTRLSIPQITNCFRTGTAHTILNGVAFIHTVAGRRRLDLVVVDSTGSGISFRGDQ